MKFGFMRIVSVFVLLAIFLTVIPLSWCIVFAEGSTRQVSTASEFVEAYNSMVSTGGAIELTDDITISSTTSLNSGTSSGKTIVIYGGTAKHTLTIGATVLFQKNIGTIELNNLNLTGAGTIAFNGNKFIARSVTSTHSGKISLTHHSATTTNADVTAEFIDSRFESGNIFLSIAGQVNGNVNIVVSGTSYIANLYCGNDYGTATSIGNVAIDVKDAANISNLSLANNSARIGNVFVNIDTTQKVNNLYLTRWGSGIGINGDVIVKVDKTSAMTINSGDCGVNGDKVLLLNNGSSITNGIDKMSTVIDSPTDAYASAVLDDDSSFAGKITVKNNSSDYDKAIVYDSEERVADYSTKNTDAGFELDIAETGTFTTDFEKSSDAQVRGGQKSNDGTAVRFIGGIDTLNCNGVGFEITANDKTWGLNPTDITGTVYTSILADGEQVTADSLASEYLFCAEIGGIPVGTESVEFTVKAFKLVNGKRVYSSEETVTVKF